MPSQGTVDVTLVPDCATDPLAVLAVVTSTVLVEHLNLAGWCVICGSPWPCQRTRLAEHNLEAL